jgi:hypothetical protein
MKKFSTFLIVLFLCFGAVESYSKEYKKKKSNYHSLGLGIGYANITSDVGEEYNPGRTIYAGYTYTRKALMTTITLNYTTFSDIEFEAQDYKLSTYDVSLLGGVYWNILQRDFYEGVTPYIGIEAGIVVLIEEESFGGSSSTNGYSLTTLSPVVGTSVPIANSIAVIIEAKYRLNLQSQGTFDGRTVITGITDYNYYTLNAGLKFNI